MMADSDFPQMSDLMRKAPTHKGMVDGVHNSAMTRSIWMRAAMCRISLS